MKTFLHYWNLASPCDQGCRTYTYKVEMPMNTVCNDLDKMLAPRRISWTAIAFLLLTAWFLYYLLPWAAAGFPVLR